MARAVTRVERQIVELFLKTVGAGTGLYRYQERLFIEGLASHGLYQENLRQVRDCLTDGWVAADLSAFIRSRYKAGDRAALLGEILSKRTRQKLKSGEDELLESEAQYQHPALFTVQAPRLRLVGERFQKCGQARRTRRESFTAQQLIEFFLAHCPFADPRRATELGPWNWLLDQATLDELLTAIEWAGQEPELIQNVFALVPYLGPARRELAERQGRATEKGVSHE